MFDLLQRYERRELALILSLVCVLGLAPLSAYMVLPKVKSHRALSVSRDTLIAAAANEGELQARLDALREKVETLERRLHGDMARLQPKEIEAYIIGRLQAISWRNRVELVGVEPGRGEAIETFREMLFKVSLAGDYFDLYEWLRDLGEELGFVVIKQYQMSPVDSAEKSPRLSAELTIASYRTMDQ